MGEFARFALQIADCQAKTTNPRSVFVTRNVVIGNFPIQPVPKNRNPLPERATKSRGAPP